MDIEALRDLIVGNVTSLEGVEAMMLSLIFCLQSRFFVHNSINFDRILRLKITIDLAAHLIYAIKDLELSDLLPHKFDIHIESLLFCYEKST